MKRRWLGLVSLFAAFSLVVAACGDDDTADTTTTTGDTTATTQATTTTAAPTTTAPPDDGMDIAFDTGVTPAPCPDAVNEGNGCIYLGVISDLTEGPFAALGVPLTKAQEDFWAVVNNGGGLEGFDVIITAENTIDAKYDPAETAAGAETLADRVLGIAQSLGTGQTQAALPIYDANDMVATPATWFSGWGFDEVDLGLVMEVGASYCLEAMNGMTFLTQARESTEFTWSIVYFPADYGGDYLAGSKLAAAQLGLPDPLDEIFLVPIAFGGDVSEAVATLAASKPDVIVMVTGPTEMAQITAGVFGTGHQFQVLGAGPTWNVGLKANADLMPLLEAVYFNTSPWAGWDYDSPGHAAMRAAAEATGQGPHNSYVAGWMFQYTWLALLKAALASGDLTRANVRAIADDLDDIDFQGMLPNGSYAGAPNDFAERATIIGRASAEASDGLMPVTDLFVSPIAANFNLAAPCFVG